MAIAARAPLSTVASGRPRKVEVVAAPNISPMLEPERLEGLGIVLIRREWLMPLSHVATHHGSRGKGFRQYGPTVTACRTPAGTAAPRPWVLSARSWSKPVCAVLGSFCA